MYEIVIGRSKQDFEKYGLKGTIFIGKHYVKMGQTTSLSNKIYLDVNGSHVFFIAGKRGSGKCLSGDTLIAMEDGSLVPIKDLENDKRDVLCLNSQLKIESSSKSDFFKRKVDRMMKVKLRSGKEIKLTPEHPLLTIKGWEPVQKLKIGSRIATPRKTDNFGDKNIPDSYVKILAYLISEGHTKKTTSFSNNDPVIADDFKKSILDFDPLLEIKNDREGIFRVVDPNFKNVVLYHPKERNRKGQFLSNNKNVNQKRKIREFLEKHELYGKGACEKYLSLDIMQLSQDKLSLFLNRLFSCDGSIYKVNSYWMISYSSSSKRLIHQVHSLLLRFGIISKIRDKKVKLNGKCFKSYEIVINQYNLVKFAQKIGFFGEKKIKESIALDEIKVKVNNPNTDTIPRDVWNFFKPVSWTDIGRKVGYKHPKAMRERVNYCPSRQTLLTVSKAALDDNLKLIAQSDIFWDEIVSIELMEGDFFVYDICVPKHHNFVANDIIVHNSYTMGAIAEGMADLPKSVSSNLSVIIFDTMGIYWTMKYPNHKDEELLKQWDLTGKGLDVMIYTPKKYFNEYKEKGIPTDKAFALKPRELAPSDWCKVFEIDPYSPGGILIERVINKVSSEIENYSLKDVIKYAHDDPRADDNTKNLVENLFQKARGWGLFSTKGLKITDLVKGGQVTVLDISVYATIPGSWGIKAMVIGIVSQRLFIERMIAKKNEEYSDVHNAERFFANEEKKKQMPLVWLMLDEAHEFLPREGETAASEALITILREGRQPGISLVLVTQQPGKIHTDVMTQSDTVIAHRLTAKMDVKALGLLMQSYMRKGLDEHINVLPRVKGAAIIFDDMNERMYPMRVRPRFTWHGGEAPHSLRKVKEEKKL